MKFSLKKDKISFKFFDSELPLLDHDSTIVKSTFV